MLDRTVAGDRLSVRAALWDDLCKPYFSLGAARPLRTCLPVSCNLLLCLWVWLLLSRLALLLAVLHREALHSRGLSAVNASGAEQHVLGVFLDLLLPRLQGVHYRLGLTLILLLFVPFCDLFVHGLIPEIACELRDDVLLDSSWGLGYELRQRCRFRADIHELDRVIGRVRRVPQLLSDRVGLVRLVLGQLKSYFFRYALLKWLCIHAVLDDLPLTEILLWCLMDRRVFFSNDLVVIYVAEDILLLLVQKQQFRRVLVYLCRLRRLFWYLCSVLDAHGIL